MITFEFLDSRFEISSLSKTGLKWKPKKEISQLEVGWNKRYAGKDCGNITIDQDGRHYFVCSVVSVEKKLYNHKIIYALYNKKDLGDTIIGHKDGNTTNNNPENLMECHNSEQYNNSKRLHVKNKSGQPGVHYDEKKKKHIAQITHKMKKIRIGAFTTHEEAVKARKEYEIKLYGS